MVALMKEHGYETAQSTICFRERESVSPCSAFVDAAAKALEVPTFLLFLPLEDCKVYGQARELLVCTSSALCAEGNERGKP